MDNAPKYIPSWVRYPKEIFNKYLFRYKFWNNDPDVSLRFKIQDGRNSPEPAYTETKASILRRRNTLAKLRQKDAESGTNTG